MKSYDIQYSEIVEKILRHGIDRMDRTGVGSRSIWGDSMSINLANGFPALTLRKVNPRIAFEEIMWMIRGETDSNILKNKKIHIWDGNTSREFLDKHDLEYLPEGQIGKGYGFQMRNFNGKYGVNYDDHIGGVDQFIQLLDGLKNDPNGRRHIICLWNPLQLHEAALVPCHLYQQYQILDGKLNSSFLMRSWDFIYGAPYNVMGYAFLNLLIAKYLKLDPGMLYAVGMDIHIYNNQMEMAEELYPRVHYSLPSIKINCNIDTIEDILNVEYKNIEIKNYKANPDFSNKPKMAV